MEHDAVNCEACKAHEKVCKFLGMSGGSLSEREQERIWKEGWRAWCKAHPPPKSANDGRVSNNKPKGLFAGTLTMRPDESTEEEMIKAINKIFSQKTCPLKKYAWYLEYTQNGTPHIHFCYETETGGRIHQKVFKRYWDWDESVKCGAGHRGGYHKACDSETAYLEYISKESGQNKVYGFSI